MYTNEETLFIDDQFTSDELDLLNMEVTPEIEALLTNYVYEIAMKEHSEFTNNRRLQVEDNSDKTLDVIIDIQEEMATIMKSIHRVDDNRKSDLAELDNWVKRFNTYKDSPVWEDVPYLEKGRVWDAYKAGLSRRKDAYHASKDQVSKLWDSWKELKNKCQEVVGDNQWLWGKYFSLASEEISPYFTNGDTQEVDDQVALYPTVNELVDIYRDEHIKEMSIINDPQPKGRGYWDNKQSSPITINSYKKDNCWIG